jgi:ABC-type uncharacterized transport system substrate-binding protein
VRGGGLSKERALSPQQDSPKGDLPAEQSIVFRLFVNLSTAKELGITIPPSVLARADEVID